jgi:rhodanese-related sulfurtransferase
MNTEVPEIGPKELALELKTAKPPVLLDVREERELEISGLEGVRHIPMGELPARFEELGRDEDLVVVCRSGARSGRVTSFLLGQGFKKVRNLAGGMNAWAREVDPSTRIY